jgi:hypothetical protein
MRPPPDNESGRPTPGAATTTPTKTYDTIVTPFARRVLVDVLAEATADYWHRRAEAFTRAMWRPGDYTGRTTPTQRAAHDADMAAIAQACRHAAQLAPLHVREVADLLWEVA